MEAEPKYPGWNLDLRWYPSREEREIVYAQGLWYTCRGSHSDVLLVRELAMMRFMDHVTDNPFWQINIFDETVVDSWRREALAIPDEEHWSVLARINADEYDGTVVNFLNDNSIDYCILELQEKAKHFVRTGIVPTLDATFGIAKSDVLVDGDLRQSLQRAVAQLQSDQASQPNWRPNTNKTTQELVDPSMYPLVYGRSLFIPDEVVGVHDAIDKWSGKGEVIPKRTEWNLLEWNGDTRRMIDPSYNPDPRYHVHRGRGTSIPVSLWSTNYQWLPSNVKLFDNGTVEFTSYINNLHPVKYCGAYRAIEKLVEKALPLWDQCLVECKPRVVTLIDRHEEEKMFHDKKGAGRHSPRIGYEMKLYKGDHVKPPYPWVDGWDDHIPDPEKIITKERHFSDPETRKERRLSRNASREREWARKEAMAECDDDDSDYSWDLSMEGSSADGSCYEEWWTDNETDTSPDPPPFEASNVDYAIDPAKSLCQRFKDSGLQIIVKVTSIELTPDKPHFPPGDWHVEGLMNERIVGTALYCLDSENVSDPSLQYYALTDPCPDWDYDCANFGYCHNILGFNLRMYGGSSCIQHYGKVTSRDGRLLAFPNVFEHQMSGFSLIDPTKPGHRSFIVLQLVDPLTRIISTANVTPQQSEWRSEAVESMLKTSTGVPPEIALLLLEQYGGARENDETQLSTMVNPEGVTLPVEVMDMIRTELGESLLMTWEEAENHQVELTQERSMLETEKNKISYVTYSFSGDWE